LAYQVIHGKEKVSILRDRGEGEVKLASFPLVDHHILKISIMKEEKTSTRSFKVY
jgi:hypothetical protein